MFCEEIRQKTRPSLHIILLIKDSFQLDSKFILMATSLGTNGVVVTKVHWTNKNSLNKPSKVKTDYLYAFFVRSLPFTRTLTLLK